MELVLFTGIHRFPSNNFEGYYDWEKIVLDVVNSELETLIETYFRRKVKNKAVPYARKRMRISTRWQRNIWFIAGL